MNTTHNNPNEIITAIRRGNEYRNRYYDEMQLRKRRENQLFAQGKYIKELEFYIQEHWKTKGWEQKLEK